MRVDVVFVAGIDAQVRVNVGSAALDHAQVRADDAQVRVDASSAAPVSGCGSGKRFR